MSSSTRFQLIVKAGEDGQSFGDCPFSQRACMFANFTTNPGDVEVKTVNLVDKPDWFLKVNPEGKAPVLIDRQENKIIPDSGDIVNYIAGLYPNTGR